MTFQTMGNGIIRDFESLDDASRWFHNPKFSGERCFLLCITWHPTPGLNGKYCSTEVLESRT